MNLAVLPGAWMVTRLPPDHEAPQPRATDTFFSVTRTPHELTVVGPQGPPPDMGITEPGFALLGVEGPIPFEVVGVLASIAEPLARAQVSIFSMSTFDTDYVLVREGALARAIAALGAAGHTVALQHDAATPGRLADLVARNGYAQLGPVVDAATCSALGAAVDAWRKHRSRAGIRGLLACPDVRALAGDPRLVAMASAVLGEAARPFRATLFAKAPAASWSVAWHQDTVLPLEQRNERPGWGPWSTKAGTLCARAPAAALERIVAIRVHLDEELAGTGRLRVLPGSHARGRLSQAEVDHLAAASTPVPCPVARGGLLLMMPLLLHASSSGTAPERRRVIHIEYAPAAGIDPDVELASG